MDVFTTSIRDASPLVAEQLDGANYRSALSQVQRVLESDSLAPLDAVIHGVGVRLYTNSAHWHRFWSANWFAPSQWATLTGDAPPSGPKVHIYATTTEAAGATVASPWAGYSAAHTAAFLTGDIPYGPLRALALAAVAHQLAVEEAVHFLPGTCIRQDGKGSLLLDSPDVDWAVAVPAQMERGGTRLMAVGGVFLRYGLVRMVDGVTMLPAQIIDEQGVSTRGYRLFPWLDDYGFAEPRADVRCLTLNGQQEYCFVRDLDLGRAPDAMAYPLEQAWYVPTRLVAADPTLVGALWPRSISENRALLENVPPLTAELTRRFGDWADAAVAGLSNAPLSSTRSLVEELGDEQVANALCRLRSAPEARALVAPEQLWPGRAGGNPWRPLRIRQVALLGSHEPKPLDAAELSQRLSDAAAYLSGLYDQEANKVLTTELGRAVSAAN